PEANPPGLIASLAVLGACMSPDPEDCVRAMAWLNPVEEAVFSEALLYDNSIVASPNLVGDEPIVWDKLKALHAAYFVCIAQNWEGSRESKQRIRKDRYSHIVSVAQSFGLFDLSLASMGPASPTKQKWTKFILLESMIRTATYIYLLDSAFVLFYRLPPRVISLELNTGLYQTTLVNVTELSPAAIGLSRWIWLWRQGCSSMVSHSTEGIPVEDLWKRVGFMQYADEYYHLACAMLERWKRRESETEARLAAWATPFGHVQGTPRFYDADMAQVKALINDMESASH
ncbi:hypothetical protein FLONG3_1775, partial [Fusarium longipes]